MLVPAIASDVVVVGLVGIEASLWVALLRSGLLVLLSTSMIVVWLAAREEGSLGLDPPPPPPPPSPPPPPEPAAWL